MSVIEELAADVGASAPTMRRAVALGLVRGKRPSPRKVEISVGERVYVRKHWERLAELRRVLRTEKSVRVAVLFGSLARGSAGPESDVDLAVMLSDETTGARLALQARLAERLGRRVQVIPLREIRAVPEMWAGVLRDGRTLVNRDDVEWAKIRGRGG